MSSSMPLTMVQSVETIWINQRYLSPGSTLDMNFLKPRCVCIRGKINRVKWGSDNKSRDSVCVYVVVMLCDSILVETCKYLKCATCSAAAHMSKVVEKNGAIFFIATRMEAMTGPRQ